MLMEKKTKFEIQPKLQHDGEKSKTWAKEHKMELHYNKTTCMAVGTRHKTREAADLNIKIGNNKIKQVDKQKFLGVIIDENFLWNAHIDYLCANISSKVSLLKQCRHTYLLKFKNCFTRVTFFHCLTMVPIRGVRLRK